MSVFAVCSFATAKVHVGHQNNGSGEDPKETIMNWIIETYSDVYSTAMMHEVKTRHHAPVARKTKTLAKLARFFGRA